MSLRSKLHEFWGALPPASRIVSRWQRSRRFPEAHLVREDETGSYKARKYTSLVPWLVEQGFRRIRLHGSSHSSSVMQLSLLLKQAGLHPVYVLEGREGPLVGNGLLSRLILGSDFSQSDVACDWAVPEGAGCAPALAGSLGLAGSLMEHALERREFPKHLYIDSGTGFTAAALLMGLGFFGISCEVHIVSMTRQDRAEIDHLVESLSPEFERLLGEEPKPLDFNLRPPPCGRSFGSTPSAVMAEVAAFARNEGVLIDPLYTAKLSLAYQQARRPGESALLFVSGGISELLGFQEPLRMWVGKGSENRAKMEFPED